MSTIKFDVLIVDQHLSILGDSDLEKISNEACIRKNSILAKVMAEKKKIIVNSKKNFIGCQKCSKINDCPVERIIGIPLIYKNNVIGSIGVIANNLEDKLKMIENEENYLKFIDRMVELIFNKMNEKEKLMEISLLSKRMEIVLDSVDESLILVSDHGKIINSNIGFNKLMGNIKVKNIKEIINEELINKVLVNKNEIKYKEIKIMDKLYLVTMKPVLLDDRNKGALIKLRPLKDVNQQINDLYTASLDINFDDLIGKSDEIIGIKNKIRQIANSSSTVLISGETGTGKEVIARLIHNNSNRKNGTFVAINCSAIPEELIESELFGYEEGAFSRGKKGGKIGKFQLADQGTLFLDEIAEMKIHLQSKLLRVLQEKSISKVGGLEDIDVDVRIIAATNKELNNLVNEDKFREDLYYRLNVIPFTVLPLRHRQGDIKILLEHYLKFYSEKLNKEANDFTDEALKKLLCYPWYGNVRELKNIIEFAINITKNNIITLKDLPRSILEEGKIQKDQPNIEKKTKELIISALKVFGYSTLGKKRAAKALGISISTFIER
jgi:transcriptional regulator with PAS, ATPase and Fis domain